MPHCLLVLFQMWASYQSQAWTNRSKRPAMCHSCFHREKKSSCKQSSLLQNWTATLHNTTNVVTRITSRHCSFSKILYVEITVIHSCNIALATCFWGKESNSNLKIMSFDTLATPTTQLNFCCCLFTAAHILLWSCPQVKCKLTEKTYNLKWALKVQSFYLLKSCACDRQINSTNVVIKSIFKTRLDWCKTIHESVTAGSVVERNVCNKNFKTLYFVT